MNPVTSDEVSSDVVLNLQGQLTDVQKQLADGLRKIQILMKEACQRGAPVNTQLYICRTSL
jgi:hypothetical protein